MTLKCVPSSLPLSEYFLSSPELLYYIYCILSSECIVLELFLVHTVDILSQIFFLVGDCSVHGQMFSNISGLSTH